MKNRVQKIELDEDLFNDYEDGDETAILESLQSLADLEFDESDDEWQLVLQDITEVDKMDAFVDKLTGKQ
jgi:hypothetical protein